MVRQLDLENKLMLVGIVSTALLFLVSSIVFYDQGDVGMSIIGVVVFVTFLMLVRVYVLHERSKRHAEYDEEWER